MIIVYCMSNEMIEHKWGEDTEEILRKYMFEITEENMVEKIAEKMAENIMEKIHAKIMHFEKEIEKRLPNGRKKINKPNSKYITDEEATEIPKKICNSYTVFKICAMKNKITNIPINLPKNLIILNIKNNELTSIPENLPKTLMDLNVSGNNLTIFPKFLPETLKLLDVSNNKITEIDEVSIPPELDMLNVSNNYLFNFPNKIPKSLTVLKIMGNSPLKYIPNYNLEDLCINSDLTENEDGSFGEKLRN